MLIGDELRDIGLTLLLLCVSIMTSSNRQIWNIQSWPLFPRARVHVASYHLTYIITVLLCLIVFIVLPLLLHFMAKPDPSPRTQYIPMVQFNRGSVNKEEVIQNARKALEKVAEYKRSANMTFQNSKEIVYYLMKKMDKREKRHFLALEAFEVYDMADFESVLAMGYELNDLEIRNSPEIDYKLFSKNIKQVRPDYDKLCYETAFTLSKANRDVDNEFCQKLENLGNDIIEGREPPLLTLYTWWPDPLTDPEVISKRTVLINWDSFRPFIVPVVFTNFRTNMAAANAHGWPCLPVIAENKDKLPIFKDTTSAMEKRFKSTFYGYALANSMFDSSLLMTLLEIKEKFTKPVTESGSPVNKDSIHQNISINAEIPILIHGEHIRMRAVGSEDFVKYEYFHKHVESIFSKNKTKALSHASNYVIYRGINFSDYESAVIDDNYLIPYLIQRSKLDKNAIINTTETILSVKTYRRSSLNEWGRRLIKAEPRDNEFNERILNKTKTHQTETTLLFKTLYDQNNCIDIQAMHDND